MATTTAPILETRREITMTRLFGELQTARFNELYYQTRASHFKRIGRWSSIVSALAASAVLANLLHDQSQLLGFGPAVWKALTLLAALAAAIGPTLGVGDKAAQMEKAALGHSIVKDRTRRLLTDLKMSPDLTAAHECRDTEIEALRQALAALDEPGNTKTRNRCWDKTLEELPSDQAWNLV
jgi:hypothetical protein